MPTTQEKTRRSRRDIARLSEELAALQSMSASELRDKYRNIFGEPTRSNNKEYLRKKLAWRMQELAEGGMSERAQGRIHELAAALPMRWQQRAKPSNSERPGEQPSPDAGEGHVSVPRKARRDSRLPEPGTVLTRIYNGTEHRVAVLESGFEYGNKHYASLSRVARVITGTPWNGYLFFGLQRRSRKRAQETGA